ncbi:unnamed protein product [Brachionus calyciflorus]|uniref:Uncharacterized protein n=1 Tax=Brachionus calyciflorus TaxID=104777 RepID=A0A813T537_9BILA|nr:unnamed protein product [Brachionus calyciflorus]
MMIIVKDTCQTYVRIAYLNASANKLINNDYEQAFISEINIVSKDIPFYECFFHFKQAEWWKKQELRLSNQYNNCSKIRKILKLAQIVAFLPIVDVFPQFKLIESEIEESIEFSDDIQKFFDYLSYTSIGYEETKKTL